MKNRKGKKQLIEGFSGTFDSFPRLHAVLTKSFQFRHKLQTDIDCLMKSLQAI